MSKKRTLDSFFQASTSKKPRVQDATSGEPEQNQNNESSDVIFSNHPTYPYKIPHFPSYVSDALTEIPASEGKEIKDQPDLDLLYFQPYIPKRVERDLFEFLREELFFYRVQYKIKRGPVETQINTPR